MKDCRDCVRWETCPCGKTGHEKGTSIGYSIGECKDYVERNQDKAFMPKYLLKPCFTGDPKVDAITIERIERYIPEIEDKVPDVASAVKGFIEIWKAEQEKQNDSFD